MRVTIQSKMNYEYTDSRYSIGLSFLERLTLEAWYKISDIPESIRTEVIQLLDRGFNKKINSVISEDGQFFLLADYFENIEEVAIKSKLFLESRYKLPYYAKKKLTIK